MSDLKKSIFQQLLFIQIVVLSLCFATITFAETVVVDDDTETVLVGKILKDQQASHNTNAQSHSQENNNPQAKATSKDEQTDRSKVTSDLKDGAIRELPTLNEPVIDQANILSVSEKQALSQQIYALHEQAKAQIGLVIVPTTGQEDIFDYSMRVAEDWKLGSAKNDNGLLITVAVNDKRIQILTGYGLEGVLPDIVLNQIIREKIQPYFKKSQYAQGLSAGLTQIAKVLNMDPDVAAQAAQELQERHEKAFIEKQNREHIFNAVAIILLVGILASYVVGNRLSAATAGVAGIAAGLIYGIGLLVSLLIGLGIFFLLITAIAQTIFQLVLTAAGNSRGGGSSGGSKGGGSSGGYRGGGGGFGGGGASGSW